MRGRPDLFFFFGSDASSFFASFFSSDAGGFSRTNGSQSSSWSPPTR